MKYYIISIFVFLIFGSCALSQNYFYVDNMERNHVRDTSNVLNLDSVRYYKIILTGKPKGVCRSYDMPLKMNYYHNIDTIKAIENLLSFEGDTRLCVLEIAKYNPRSSYYWAKKNKNYSVQVEALFMINQLCIPNPFSYSPIPALVDETNKSTGTIDEAVIKKAFQSYKNWLKLVKESSLSKVLSQNIMPLDNSGVKWFP
jgi:hypothetical protein